MGVVLDINGYSKMVWRWREGSGVKLDNANPSGAKEEESRRVAHWWVTKTKDQQKDIRGRAKPCGDGSLDAETVSLNSCGRERNAYCERKQTIE